MLKNVVNSFVVVVPAGRAVNGPPLGPILGQYGIHAVSFCKQFNDLTSGLDDFDEVVVYVSVRVDLYDDRSFGLFFSKPSVSFLVKLVSGIILGSSKAFRQVLKKSDIIRIAKFKFPYLPLSSSSLVVLNVAKSLGIYLKRSKL